MVQYGIVAEHSVFGLKQLPSLLVAV